MASFGFPGPAVAGISTATARHVRPDPTKLWLLRSEVGWPGHSRADSAVGSTLAPTLRSNLPSPDSVSPLGLITLRAVRSQYRVPPGRPRAVQIFHNESGFVRKPFGVNMGENEFSVRPSIREESLRFFQVLSPRLPGSGCLCSLLGLRLKDPAPSLSWRATSQGGLPKAVPQYCRAGRSPSPASSSFSLSYSHLSHIC